MVPEAHSRGGVTSMPRRRPTRCAGGPFWRGLNGSKRAPNGPKMLHVTQRVHRFFCLFGLLQGGS